MDSPNAHQLTLDSAAVFACANSLWEQGQKEADRNSVNLSEAFNGFDEFMREVMRIGNLFEAWACENVDFVELGEVWAYFLGDNFGDACLSVRSVSELAQFGCMDCVRVALRLKIPLHVQYDLPVPVDLKAPNPVAGAGFVAYRIQSIRPHLESGDMVPFRMGDEPFDEAFDDPYFGFYGVKKDGLLEHIADRANVEEALALAQNIVPGIEFKEERRHLSPRNSV